MTAKKVDLSEFYKLSRPKRRPCPVGYALTQLNEDEAEQLTSACGTDPGVITHASVHEWLKRRDQASTVSAVVIHRKGNCSCANT